MGVWGFGGLGVWGFGDLRVELRVPDQSRLPFAVRGSSFCNLGFRVWGLGFRV